jgi:hypothetical protein
MLKNHGSGSFFIYDQMTHFIGFRGHQNILHTNLQR